MKNIFIIGNSSVVVSLIQDIRASDAESAISLFCPEGRLPYERHLLSAALAKEIKDEELLAAPEDFYQDHQVTVVLKKGLHRINVKNRWIIMDDKERRPFDLLILADLPQWQPPDIKGSQRQGVYYLNRWQGIVDIREALSLTESVAIEVDSLASLKAADALAQEGKEVLGIFSTPTLLPEFFNEELARLVGAYLTKKKIRFFPNAAFQEILGDSDVKAVRLTTGKVLACQMVLSSQWRPDLRLLADSGLDLTHGIPVNDFFATTQDGVFALDQLVAAKAAYDERSTTAFLKEQARVLAAYMNGRETQFCPPVKRQETRLWNWTIHAWGETQLQPGAFELTQHLPASEEYLRLSFDAVKVRGVAFLNCRERAPALWSLFTQERSFSLSDILWSPAAQAGQSAKNEPLFNSDLQPKTSSPESAVAISS